MMMRRGGSVLVCAAALACGALGVAAVTRGEGRSAKEILKEVDAIKLPDPNKAKDREEAIRLLRERVKGEARRAELAGELYRADPTNERLPKLMADRWMSQLGDPELSRKARAEVDEVIAGSKAEAMVVEALFVKAGWMTFSADDFDDKAAMAAIDRFVRRAPKDERGAELLDFAARRRFADDDHQKDAIKKRILADYPKSKVARAYEVEDLLAEGMKRRKGAVGKPFALEFKDAINGKTVSMKDLRGKVVVIDFWATWCPPCVAEMPNLKRLYAKYRDQGVEFVGVSLDSPAEQGSLDDFKKFVADKQIPWPQYYQGDGWESDFSVSWGIESLPTVFVVAPDGTLASTDAHGKLEELLPELLKGAKAGKPKAEG